MRKYLWVVLLIIGLTVLCASPSFASEGEDDGWWEEVPVDIVKITWTFPVLPPTKPVLPPEERIIPRPGDGRIVCMALGCERLPIGYSPLPGPETSLQDNVFIPTPIYPPTTNPLPVLGGGSSGGAAGDTGTTGGTPSAAGATDEAGTTGEIGTTGVSAAAPIVPPSVWIMVPLEGGLKEVPVNAANKIPQVSRVAEVSAYFAFNSNAKITLKGNIKPQEISGMRGFRLSLPSCITSF